MNGSELGLTGYDDLFETDESREIKKQPKVVKLSIEEIADFPEHPFKVNDDDKMKETVESIKENGVLVPAIVRQTENGYQMVSGHRRKYAARQAGLSEIPCIVQELTDDQAIVIMVDSNLHRDKILPSEKAKAYKMKLEAMKRQGRRSDLTSAPMGPKLRSNEELAKKSEDSVSQIKRFVRLTELIPELLELVDEGKIAFRPAVELSYLSQEEQKGLYDKILSEQSSPSLAQAQELKKLSKEEKLNDEAVSSIMRAEKPNQKQQIRLPKERIAKYFPSGASDQKIMETILKALELYRKRERSREARY